MNNNENFYVLLKNLIKEREVEKLKNEIERILTNIEQLIRKSQIGELSKELNIQKNIWTKTIKQERAKNSFEFLIGRYSGYLEFLEKYLFVLKKEEKQNKLYSESLIENIPHINDIIISIAKNNGIRHGKLAEQVGIEKNTLTNIMDKLYNYDIITFLRPGKYKYYYLTENGHNYYEKNLSNITASMDINLLIEQLLITISRDKNPSETVSKIIKALYEQKYLCEGYASNQKINPVSLLPTIASLQPFEVKIPKIENTYKINTAFVAISRIANKNIPQILLTDNENFSIRKAIIRREA